MKVLVITGSRRGTSKTDVLKQLIREVDLVLTGGAPGVDSQAKRIAAELGVHTATIDALWGKFHNGAGPKRNGKLAEAAAVWQRGGAEVRFAAFPWPGSTESGTHNCMGQLLAAGIAGDQY